MKELPVEFIGRGEVRGFVFTQVHASKEGFVYRVDGGGTPYFEAFKRRENTRFGTITYPSAKAFGKWAIWTRDLDKATAYVHG